MKKGLAGEASCVGMGSEIDSGSAGESNSEDTDGRIKNKSEIKRRRRLRLKHTRYFLIIQ